MIPSGRRPRPLPTLARAVAAAWLLGACARPSPPPPGASTAAATAPAAPPVAPPVAPPIGELVARLSEPGGDFNSDNLISNESSYLHVMGALRALGVRGGAYVGVGPDQNFSYIAEIRPTVAFLIDIRRDNLLVHLMYKALFARARNRAEYVALWTGRPVPADVERWTDRPIDAIAAHFDSLPATPASARAARDVVVEGVRASGVAVSDAELAYVERVHAAFVQDGLGITFTSRGRTGRPNYPTLRQLVTERDLDGAQAGYLATEERFRFVKELEARDLVIPVVGNLAGPHALAAIGKMVRERGETISALYTSNVEQYLMRDGIFAPFAHTVAVLPRDARSVIIRSYFGGFGAFGGGHPQSVPGYLSTQVLQTIDAFTAEQARGGFQTYYDVVTKGVVDLRRPRG